VAARRQARGNQAAGQRRGAVVQLPVGEFFAGNETNGWGGRARDPSGA
jgi:hypothetical protein